MFPALPALVSAQHSAMLAAVIDANAQLDKGEKKRVVRLRFFISGRRGLSSSKSGNAVGALFSAVLTKSRVHALPRWKMRWPAVHPMDRGKRHR
jgi:hypothetical protein